MQLPMMWWKEIALLKRQLKELQQELEKEQGKATRLAGFMGRLAAFGISPTGQIPRRAFAEALIDSVHTLLAAEQVLFLAHDHDTLDLLPVAARGFSPQLLSRLRVRAGEGALGRAAQGTQAVIVNSSASSAGAKGEDVLVPPYMILPLVSQTRAIGLLAATKPSGETFSAEERGLASLLATQAALILEDHLFYEDRERSKEQAVQALARAIEAKDVYSHTHSIRTRMLVRAFMQALSLPEILVRQVEDGAFLHDVGKIGIPDAILKKTGELTPEEYDIMKTHSAIGRNILEAIPALRAVAAIVLYHQEWYNGSGYPEGLAGEEIPLGARLVQIIDAWDAMTSDRPYHKAIPKEAAVAELRRQAGSQFDPKLVEVFLHTLERLEREGIPTTEHSHVPLVSQKA